MKDTGGPAFPKPDVEFNKELIYTHSGMTLRQWYAGQALAGITTHGVHPPALIASDAFAIADAMIAAEKDV